MSAKDIRQGRSFAASVDELAERLRRIAGQGIIRYDDPGIIRESADRLEELRDRLVEVAAERDKALGQARGILAALDDYDEKRHSGLLEE